MNQGEVTSNSIYDLIIVGGGPAGLTAGLYACRARLKTLLIEDSYPGGQIVVADKVENFPGFSEGIKGSELTEKFKKQAETFGLEIISQKVNGLDEDMLFNVKLQIVKTKDKVHKSLAVIIATGTKLKELNIPGENEFRGKGISYCATCDGMFFKDQDVVVIGGGDTALEEALFLTRFAKKVILIHRRDKLRATKILQERAFSNKKIEFIWDSVVAKISGKKKVEAVKIKNLKNQEQTSIFCKGVFIFIGFIPHTDFLRNLIKLDENGYIITDENMRTSKEGIFAAGDCRAKLLRQVITACGDGATAAFSAQQYIDELKR